MYTYTHAQDMHICIYIHTHRPYIYVYIHTYIHAYIYILVLYSSFTHAILAGARAAQACHAKLLSLARTVYAHQALLCLVAPHKKEKNETSSKKKDTSAEAVTGGGRGTEEEEEDEAKVVEALLRQHGVGVAATVGEEEGEIERCARALGASTWAVYNIIYIYMNIYTHTRRYII